MTPYRFPPGPLNVSFAKRQRGLTLIELMVAITVGLFVVAALAILFSQQSFTQNELEKSSRQVENGRYAMSLLRDDIRLAGYINDYGGTFTPPSTLPDPCFIPTTASDASLDAALALPVQGYDAAVSASTSFSPTSLGNTCSSVAALGVANVKEGTDILVVRRADPLPVGSTGVTIAASGVYVQAGVKNETFGYAVRRATSASAPSDFSYELIKSPSNVRTAVAAPVRNYVVNIYYVSPCSRPASGSNCSAQADNGTPIPTLKRLELSGASFVSVPLVEGIEDMQVEYGYDSAGADGVPDTFGVAPTSAAAAANITAVRIHLLARNTDRTPGHTDTKVYSLGSSGIASGTSTAGPFGDGYKRHVFSQVIRVVNPSARRDQ